MIFTKIDKKVLVILIVVLVVAVILGFSFYKYFISRGLGVKNAAKDNAPQVQLNGLDVKAEGQNGGGTLSVCVDECGNGVCQQTDLSCGSGSDLNCICAESAKDCPEDCK